MKDEEQPEDETPNEPQPPADAAENETLAQLKTENEQLKAAIRVSQAHRQITAELAKAGARSPELLFTSVRDDLQFAGDGTLQNAAAIVTNLKAKFPEQFGNDTAGRSIDAGSGMSIQDPLNPASLARMTADEIARLDWEDVKRVLASK
jgi:hypothetical protein